MILHNPVNRLLRRNISVGQILGYAVANFVGLAILLTALQFYRDTTKAENSADDSFISRDFLIVSKHVSDINTLKGRTSGFSAEDIADLSRQPWVEKVGEFTPSRFHVNGAVEFGGRGMSTHLFFESIPDEFFDVRPEGWGFNPADSSAIIPIVISRDYLALYNFGFAASRGMPQLSEQIVGSVPLQLSLSGNGRRVERTGEIVGFSSRLNTIAVPESFMQWANAEFGDDTEPAEVSRLIVQTNDPGNPAIEKYFNENGIEVSGEKLNQGRAAYFLSIVSAVVIVIGLVICALAFFILMLSISLLLQKNKDKIHDLLMLGYTPRQVGAYYYRMVAALNGSILVAALIVTLIASRLWTGVFAALGLTTTGCGVTILAGVVLMALVTCVNIIAIHRNVNRNFYNS
ncbi:MAG: ABC transporter permease [Bacteroidales bacterium]|nr:ABC transporter permease [Bacteroidales bacterium]